MDTVLLTGGTGFLGTEIALRLLDIPNIKIYALVRAENEEAAFHRLKTEWQLLKKLSAAVGINVFPICGDFTKKSLGLNKNTLQKLYGSISLVIHAGAEIGFQKSEEEFIKTNYIGTKNMLTAAANMKKLRRFIHISTAYVSGLKKGVITEDEPLGNTFSGMYEKSKAKAEMLVRKSSLPFSVCRPGMIVGDSRSGRIKNFNTVYYILKLILLGKMPVLPMKPQTPLNIIPVDYAADSVIKISFSKNACGKTFHLTCPSEYAPKAKELVEYVERWGKENLHTDIRKPLFLSVPALKYAGILYGKKQNRKKSFLSNLLMLMPYFFGGQIYGRKNTDSICGKYTGDWHEYIDKLLEFACRKNFMRQTGRTVFEQAAERRESSRYPINYYNITKSGIKKISGKDFNRHTEKIKAALLANGIKKGDRIAITGVNSAEYMMLEQAVGLVGAVSVPIYYTAPPEEISVLLKKSEAKYFFVGDGRISEQADKIKTAAKLVSFSEGAKFPKPNVMTWYEFLKKQAKPHQTSYIYPDDIATIRYTSGTTGDPKGVMFDHSQLVWMGEVLTNFISWKERNKEVRYLSFLPLSHVVEGILAAYAPYYMLSDTKIYYLNDFAALTEALPKVRPTVFFSVPRFYEKLWEQIISTKAGKMWYTRKDGIYKSFLAILLKKAVLRKAGLDKCGQLIAGSAQISETLLLNFRSLGIEIYNAYGQTEAPLITINRLGDNVIPTVGTPLPDTEVCFEKDNELIVKGPQVTKGYYGLESENIQNGILKTGDLGFADSRGHITLCGRKKEIIVTAYGKNISIPKIEERLKNINGIAQAVLIGENRPYCTALLWLDNDIADLDRQIEKINSGLSHPEQIRKYRIISRPLSISKGELTPNLKVKRGNVIQSFIDEIEEMYH